MSKEKEIKCEYPQWKAEKELKEKAAEAKQEAKLYKKRLDNAKAVIVGAVVMVIMLLIMAIGNGMPDTAAEATAAILTDYEKEFKAETGTEERIAVAAEVDRIFKGVRLGDLPEKNAEFLESCRTITKQLGNAGNTEEK